MKRAIDANLMKKELLWGNVFLSAKEINALVDLIDNQPTLTTPNEPLCQENKIIIVKCKECKYHKPIDYCEKHNDSGWYDNDFCSFGKKKIKENKYE